MTILACFVPRESNVMSTCFAWASKEFLTSSNTAMKSSVINSLPRMVLSAELILNLTLGISEKLLQHDAHKLCKKRRYGVAILGVARDLTCTPLIAGSVVTLELEPVRKCLNPRTLPHSQDSGFRIVEVVVR